DDLDQKIIPSLVLDHTDVKQAVKTLFDSVGGRFVIAPEVRGVVTLDLRNVSFATALRNILSQVDATYRIEAGVYQIIRREQPGVPPGGPGFLPPIDKSTTGHPSHHKSTRRRNPLEVKTSTTRRSKSHQNGATPPRTRSSRRTAKPGNGPDADQKTGTTSSEIPENSERTAQHYAKNPADAGKLDVQYNKQMALGRMETFKAWLRLAAAPKPSGPVTQSDSTLVYYHMRASLEGDPEAFDIQPKDSQPIDIPEADTGISAAGVVWSVRPRLLGTHDLHVKTWIVYGDGRPPVPVEDRIYSVDANFSFPATLQFWAVEHWQWPTLGGGTIGLGTLGAFFGLKLRKKKGAKRSSKSLIPPIVENLIEPPDGS
ncbi:MAG TPA: hypothetical protein VG820_12915, partial [Fimbriimonadaceae bacterium]|nr:hypothetical protein [Fimbriimonadaceae bacterium]